MGLSKENLVYVHFAPLVCGSRVQTIFVRYSRQPSQAIHVVLIARVLWVWALLDHVLLRCVGMAATAAACRISLVEAL